VQYRIDELRDKMRQETERFLERAMRSVRDPRAEYAKLLREMQASASGAGPERTPPVRQRPAA